MSRWLVAIPCWRGYAVWGLQGNVRLVDLGFAEEMPADGFLTDSVGTTM